jgi:hypothetical protein
LGVTLDHHVIGEKCRRHDISPADRGNGDGHYRNDFDELMLHGCFLPDGFQLMDLELAAGGRATFDLQV